MQLTVLLNYNVISYLHNKLNKRSQYVQFENVECFHVMRDSRLQVSVRFCRIAPTATALTSNLNLFKAQKLLYLLPWQTLKLFVFCWQSIFTCFIRTSGEKKLFFFFYIYIYIYISRFFNETGCLLRGTIWYFKYKSCYFPSRKFQRASSLPPLSHTASSFHRNSVRFCRSIHVTELSGL